MRAFNKERLKELRQFNETIPELNLPPKKQIDIYCHFDFCLNTNGLAIWNYDKDDQKNAIAAHASIVPISVCFSAPHLDEKNKKLGKYVYGFSTEQPHEGFFEMLRNFYRNNYIPRLWLFNAKENIYNAIKTFFKQLDPDLLIISHPTDDGHLFRCKMKTIKYDFAAVVRDAELYEHGSLLQRRNRMGIVGTSVNRYKMANVEMDEESGQLFYTNWSTGQRSVMDLDEYKKSIWEQLHYLKRYHRKTERRRRDMDDDLDQSQAGRVFDITIASHVKSLLDLYIQERTGKTFKDLYRQIISEQDYTRFFYGLFGGAATTFNKVTKYVCADDEIIVKYDNNALYPYAMTFGIGSGPLLDTKPADSNKYVEYICAKVKSIKWNGVMAAAEEPPYPKDKWVGASDNNGAYYVKELWTFLMKNADIEFEEIGRKWQRRSYIAGDFVTWLYRLRMETKEQEKEMEDLIFELECSYAERSEIDELTEEKQYLSDYATHLKFASNCIYGKLCELVRPIETINVNGKNFHQVKDDSRIELENTAAGACVAQYGRLIHYRKIREVLEMGWTPLYADTDSIAFALPRKHKHLLSDVFKPNNRKMGEWKWEGEWDTFLYNGQMKRYAFLNRKEREISVTLAGLQEEFKKALHHEKKNDFGRAVKALEIIFSNNVNFVDGTFEKFKNKRGEYITIPADLALDRWSPFTHQFKLIKGGTSFVIESA